VVLEQPKETIQDGAAHLRSVAISDHAGGQATAFMAMIFFFAEHRDPKKAQHVLVGGVSGIACILLAGPIIAAPAPLIGFEFARLAYILGVVLLTPAAAPASQPES
jgi:hypothetical protein